MSFQLHVFALSTFLSIAIHENPVQTSRSTFLLSSVNLFFSPTVTNEQDARKGLKGRQAESEEADQEVCKNPGAH